MDCKDIAQIIVSYALVKYHPLLRLVSKTYKNAVYKLYQNTELIIDCEFLDELDSATTKLLIHFVDPFDVITAGEFDISDLRWLGFPVPHSRYTPRIKTWTMMGIISYLSKNWFDMEYSSYSAELETPAFTMKSHDCKETYLEFMFARNEILDTLVYPYRHKIKEASMGIRGCSGMYDWRHHNSKLIKIYKISQKEVAKMFIDLRKVIDKRITQKNKLIAEHRQRCKIEQEKNMREFKKKEKGIKNYKCKKNIRKRINRRKRASQTVQK